MRIDEIIPDRPTRLACPSCQMPMVLGLHDFDEDVEGIRLTVTELPRLECPGCGMTTFPDRSRVALLELHYAAWESKRQTVRVKRQRLKRFKLTKVQFEHDPDDYFYLPGLARPTEDGYLTPVFFNRSVLLKPATWPGYRVRFASRTYGSIHKGESFSIPFGINRHGRVVMWLGDIAMLPKAEQHYLRSENTESDHDIGCEFYDAQIECVFTPRCPEDQMMFAWGNFLESAFKRFGAAIDTLRDEALAAMEQFTPPISGQSEEIADKFRILNMVTVEALNSAALAGLAKARGTPVDKLGSLKLLQAVLIHELPGKAVADMLLPLFVLYDMRVLASHLHSTTARTRKLASAATRLRLAAGATDRMVYEALLAEGDKTLSALAAALANHAPHVPATTLVE